MADGSRGGGMRLTGNERSQDDLTTQSGPLPLGDMDSFIGRSVLIGQAKKLLEEVRLLTLIGIGGVGKTRLMQQLTAQIATNYRHGVVTVYLADLKRNDGRLAATIADALGLQDNSPDPDDAVRVLKEHLQDREMLVVLDNCEHLVGDAGPLPPLLRRLMEDAPSVTVLATSRVRVGVRGEHHLLVQPLSVGDGDESPAMSEGAIPEALQLFVDRARAYEVTIEESDYPLAMRLCRTLDGIPLAVELAAAQLGPISLRDLLELLEQDPLDVLVDGDSEQKHQVTMRSTLEWSWRLLSPSEQYMWRSAAVFEGSFDRAAVRDVCGIDDRDAVTLLSSLVRRSVLSVAEDDHDGSTRYRMPVTIRAYGLEQLSEEEFGLLQRAYADYYGKLMARAAEEWFGPEEILWMRRLRRDLSNFRAARAFYLADGDLHDKAVDIATNETRTRFPIFAGMLYENVHTLTTALDRRSQTRSPRQVVGLSLASWVAHIQGDQARAKPLLVQAEKLALELGCSDTLPPLINARGTSVWLTEPDPAKARNALPIFRQAIEASREAGGSPGDLHMLELFEVIATAFLGDESSARELASQLLLKARAAGARWALSWALWACALVELRFGDPADTMTLADEGLDIQQAIDDKWGWGWTKWLMGLAAARLGDYELAGYLIGNSTAIQKVTQIHIPGLFPFLRLQHQILGPVRDAIGDEELAKLIKKGESGDYDKAALKRILRLGASKQHRGPQPSPGGLSKREWEVAGLVSGGLTNREIGVRLSIQERTVETHVANVLQKLQLKRRVQIANWYLQHPQLERP